jgi:GNAT superfamily N-acetyltransferase
MLGDGYWDIPADRIATVVTSLEMTARPSPRPALSRDPSGPAMILRAVPQPPLDWYRDLYARIGTDWLWFSRLRMEPQALREIIHAPRVEIHALVFEEHDEGLLELDFRTDGECELAFFGLTNRLLGKGAGRVLMSHALDLAWSRPINRVWVHTCTLDHPNALAFYIRSGFRPYRRQVEIAADPRLSGVLPLDAASHTPVIGP